MHWKHSGGVGLMAEPVGLMLPFITAYEWFIVRCIPCMGDGLNPDVLSAPVMLQPFPYDPKEKNKHKFMVMTMVAPEGAIDNQDALVSPWRFLVKERVWGRQGSWSVLTLWFMFAVEGDATGSTDGLQAQVCVRDAREWAGEAPCPTNGRFQENPYGMTIHYCVIPAITGREQNQLCELRAMGIQQSTKCFQKLGGMVTNFWNRMITGSPLFRLCFLKSLINFFLLWNSVVNLT